MERKRKQVFCCVRTPKQSVFAFKAHFNGALKPLTSSLTRVKESEVLFLPASRPLRLAELHSSSSAPAWRPARLHNHTRENFNTQPFNVSSINKTNDLDRVQNTSRTLQTFTTRLCFWFPMSMCKWNWNALTLHIIHQTSQWIMFRCFLEMNVRLPLSTACDSDTKPKIHYSVKREERNQVKPLKDTLTYTKFICVPTSPWEEMILVEKYAKSSINNSFKWRLFPLHGSTNQKSV